MEDIQFSNMDSWRGSGDKFGLTFKQIILLHINRCVQNGSVEMRGGYWNEVGHNPTQRTYVNDSRDVYCNSVKMLRALLLGYYDKKMQEANDKLKEEFDSTYEEYSEKEKNDKQIKYEWYEFRVRWHMGLFEELIMLSKRLNFFEEESSEEEM